MMTASTNTRATFFITTSVAEIVTASRKHYDSICKVVSGESQSLGLIGWFVRRLEQSPAGLADRLRRLAKRKIERRLGEAPQFSELGDSLLATGSVTLIGAGNSVMQLLLLIRRDDFSASNHHSRQLSRRRIHLHGQSAIGP